MVKLYPFSASLDERHEIRQVGQILFSGGDATAFPETADLLIKWNPFFQVFLQSVDRKSGTLLHLPFPGGVFEQPAKTMTVLMLMQEEYLRQITDALKNTSHRK